ncbi:MAG: hypothetical protein U0176_14845 [Bacteroidia bacterium]
MIKAHVYLVLVTLWVVLLPILPLAQVEGNSKTPKSNHLAARDSVKTKNIVVDSSALPPSIVPLSDTVKVSTNDSIVLGNGDIKNQSVRVYIMEAKSPSLWLYILPVFTLLLGILVNRSIDRITDRKRIKRAGKRWIAELNCLESPIQIQVKYLTDFLAIHNQEKFEVPVLNAVQILDCEAFLSLDKADFLEYIERVKRKKYEEAVSISNRIMVFVSILRNLLLTTKTKFETYLHETSGHTTNLSKNLQTLLKQFAEYSIQLEAELKSDPTNDPRYKPILELFGKEILPRMESGNFDPYSMETDFCIPLLRVLSTLRLGQKTFPMAQTTSDCLNCIKGIKMEKQYLKENFETIIKLYQEEEVLLRFLRVEGTNFFIVTHPQKTTRKAAQW